MKLSDYFLEVEQRQAQKKEVKKLLGVMIDTKKQQLNENEKEGAMTLSVMLELLTEN
jgi:hypothetical protein